jgi:hypothetical protein
VADMAREGERSVTATGSDIENLMVRLWLGKLD